jgi:hypothetical protein
MSTAVLGLSTTLATSLGTSILSLGVARSSTVRALCFGLACAIALKLVGELSVLSHLRDKQQSDLKRSALLLRGELAPLLKWRVGVALFGGVLLPLAIAEAIGSGAQPGALAAIAGLLGAGTTLAGELLERLLFFSAVSAPRMPGGLK